MKLTNKRYEAPQAELIEIESQSVLCASGPSTTTGAGGTTNMTMNNALVW